MPRKLYKMTDGSKRVLLHANNYFTEKDFENMKRNAVTSEMTLQDYLDYCFQLGVQHDASEGGYDNEKE